MIEHVVEPGPHLADRAVLAGSPQQPAQHLGRRATMIPISVAEATHGGASGPAARRPVLPASSRRGGTAVGPDENTYVRGQNARVDPMLTLGTITVAGLRDILADLPDDAVVVVTDGAGGDDASPLADVEEGWYFPAAGDSAPLGRDADGNVHEPGPRDLYAVLLHPSCSDSRMRAVR